MSEPVFLALDEVLALHLDQIRRYGGKSGVRDLTLLQSALAMPQAVYAGEYLHTSLPEMAAAYLFHLVANHPFVDGNKRAGLIAALAFLGLDDLELEADGEVLFDLVMRVASGEASKADAAVFFQEHARAR